MAEGWTQDTSELYRKLAHIAVPARMEQIAVLLTLIPFAAADAFRVVELAAGEGLLSAAIAEAFPNASILALDYEQSMRETAASRLSEYGARAQVGEFDIHSGDWFNLLEGADLVISSLCIHHLLAVGKRNLFREVHSKLQDHGALLIADIVAPQIPQANQLFAATWDRMAEVAANQQTSSKDLYRLFENEQWNYYRFPDEFDQPSPLYAQLRWLEEAGFKLVDCFWMQAGHAVYGGYKAHREPGIPFYHAMKVSEKVFNH